MEYNGLRIAIMIGRGRRGRRGISQNKQVTKYI